MNRLWGRLTIAMVLIAVVTVGLVGLVTRDRAANEVRTLFESTLSDEDFDPLLDPLLDPDLAGLDAAVAAVAARSGSRIIVADADLRVVADSDPNQFRPDLATLVGDSDVETDDGRLYVIYALRTRVETAALASLDRLYASAAIAAALLAAVAAVLMGLWLSRPLRALESSVRAIDAGDLSQRATEAGPDEIQAIARAVNRLAEGLAASIASQRRVTADIAHELRTPVANVLAYVEGMMDGLADPDGADLEVVHAEVLRLRALINDLQDLALSESGELSLRTERLDGRDVADAAVAAARHIAAAAEIALSLDTGEEACTVTGDAHRLQQAVANLVDNAIRHTPIGGAVRVSCRRESRRVVWRVDDAGEGIDEAHLPLVFQRLHRVDDARTPGGGAGLGLAITKALAVLHGGGVSVTNRPSGGARFELWVPTAGSTSIHLGAAPPDPS